MLQYGNGPVEDEEAMIDVPHYVHWWFIQLSVPNLVVIVLMLVVFALALVLPYPHRRLRVGGR
jgi:hypothetical protein